MVMLVDEKTSEKIKEFIRNECYHLINIREQVDGMKTKIEETTKHNDNLADIDYFISMYRGRRIQYTSEFHVLSSMCHILDSEYVDLLHELLGPISLNSKVPL